MKSEGISEPRTHGAQTCRAFLVRNGETWNLRVYWLTPLPPQFSMENLRLCQLHPEEPCHFLLQDLTEQVLEERHPRCQKALLKKRLVHESPLPTFFPTTVALPAHIIIRYHQLFKSEEDLRDSRENLDLFVQLLRPMEVEEVEEKEATSPSPSVTSFLSVLFHESQDEAAAAETASPPHSPQGSCPPPLPALAASPCSQLEDEGSGSPDKEGPSRGEGSEEAGSTLQSALDLKKHYLVAFLLLKYRAREQTTKAEMLSRVIKEHQGHFPEILGEASKIMRLVFGIDVKEVDRSAHTYVLVTTLGLTYDGMVGNGPRLPTTGLLVEVLWLIAAEGDCAPEKEIWKALNVRGVHAGKKHRVYGDPRELLTKVWVQEQYLEYRQVPNTQPVRYEFLWGPRAHAETTKVKVLEFFPQEL